jgi:ketosteroid isomerase-like protein
VSRKNVEIVRRAVAAFNARDRDRALSLCDPEIEFRSPLEQETYRGLDGMVRWTETVDAALEDFHFEDLRYARERGFLGPNDELTERRALPVRGS